jgi:hypothetical protein
METLVIEAGRWVGTTMMTRPGPQPDSPFMLTLMMMTSMYNIKYS